MGYLKTILIEIDEAIEAGVERWEAVSDAIERWELSPSGTIATHLERIYIGSDRHQDDADSDIPQSEPH